MKVTITWNNDKTETVNFVKREDGYLHVYYDEYPEAIQKIMVRNLKSIKMHDGYDYENSPIVKGLF